MNKLISEKEKEEFKKVGYYRVSKEDKLGILIVFIVMIWCLLVITACLKTDRYINELEEKANKYEILVNKVGDIE